MMNRLELARGGPRLIDGIQRGAAAAGDDVAKPVRCAALVDVVVPRQDEIAFVREKQRRDVARQEARVVAMRARGIRTVMDDDEAPNDARLGIGLRERAL